MPLVLQIPRAKICDLNMSPSAHKGDARRQTDLTTPSPPRQLIIKEAVEHIRPHQLFELVQTQTSLERAIRLVLPGKYPTSLLLETAVLIALCKVVNARTVFEFGTLFGVQTLNLAMNLPDSARVFTLDLDFDSFRQIMHLQHEQDREASRVHLEHQSQLAFLGTPYEDRITRLFGDSNEFDFSPFQGTIDVVYVDGGHDLPTARSDTENALKLLPADTIGAVAWHDYRNPDYPDLTRYLDELSRERTTYHVEESTICFFLWNAPQSVAAKLRGSP